MNYDELKEDYLRDPFGYSEKWARYSGDVLPLWVADMDFPVEPKIKKAMVNRLEHNLGYPDNAGDPALLDAILKWQSNLGLNGLEKENLWLTTSVVPAIYASVLGLTEPGDEVIVQTPVYYPFLNALKEQGRIAKHCALVPNQTTWEIDFKDLETLVTPKTKLLMLCSPQNPTGRVFTRNELEKLGEFVLRHNLLVMVDELWAELIFDGAHIPFASLSDEIALRTVTLNGPCKSYNIAGLGGGVVVSHNKELIRKMQTATRGIAGHPNVLGMAAWLSALEDGGSWLEQTREYLKQNRNFLTEFLHTNLPEIGYIQPQGTYLAFLNFNETSASHDAFKLILEQGKVALSEGSVFSPDFKGWLRINFATSKPILEKALIRIVEALRTP